jgi:cyclophilin family peptidyl-prolyl cis-trans isomerase/HEAT repeat protein
MRALAILATALVAGCPTTKAPHARDDRPLRLRVAQLEARRGAGLADLVALASSGDANDRALALRALGRVGGDRALDALQAALSDRDWVVAAAAADALAIASSLDELTPERRHAIDQLLERAIAEHRGGDTVVRDVMVVALGRVGEPAARATIIGSGARPEAIARAFGRFARRELPFDDTDRRWLVAATQVADVGARYAATYALAREHAPPKDADVVASLAARVADQDGEIRAIAIGGLARRDAIAAARPAIETALRDRDWRVAVEAVHALAGPHGDGPGRDAVAAAIAARILRWSADADAHVVMEALRALAAHGSSPLVAQALALARGADTKSALASAWIHCLAQLAIERAKPSPDARALAGCDIALPDHLRLPLLAELRGSRDALAILSAHRDPRVRAAGLKLLVASAEPDEQQAVAATLAAALADREPAVREAAAELLEPPSPDGADALRDQRAFLDAAIVAHAPAEPDVELAATLYELIGKRKIAAGEAPCRAALAGHPVRARAARGCLRALGEAAPPLADPPAAEPPPVDVADVIGGAPRWRLDTTRGPIVIELRPDVAPWAVATIVKLTRDRFYDGVELHRVVPGFVVQGGDPTATGLGGPGFTTPAEPNMSQGWSEYIAGAVGIADAGRDSGGSQFFFMHAAAPHLDSRYTWIGRIVEGQKVADALLIGDRILAASVLPRARD